MKKHSPNFAKNLDWNLLKTFHEIVQSGGVSRASQALGRKQPAISLALMRLEAQLGVTLCVRGPRGFELTDEGQLVAEASRAITGVVQQVPKRLDNMTEEVVGRVSIQVISSLVCDRLDSAISRFHGSHPKTEIIIDITTWESVAGALLRDEIDIGVAPVNSLRADLKYDFLFEEVHRAYIGRTHPLFGRTFREPAALRSEAFVLTGADEPDLLTAYRRHHGLGQSVAGLSEHLDEAKRLAILGVGICFLPVGFAEPDVRAGRLWPVLETSDHPNLPVYVITNPRAPRNLAKQMLLFEIGIAGAAH